MQRRIADRSVEKSPFKKTRLRATCNKHKCRIYSSRSFHAQNQLLTVFSCCVFRTAQEWNYGRRGGLSCRTCASSITEVSPGRSAHASLVPNWLKQRWLLMGGLKCSRDLQSSELSLPVTSDTNSILIPEIRNEDMFIRKSVFKSQLLSRCCAGRKHIYHFNAILLALWRTDGGTVGQTDSLSPC